MARIGRSRPARAYRWPYERAAAISAATTPQPAPTTTTTYGSIAIYAACLERSAAVNTWTSAGDNGFINSVNDGGTSSVAHTAIDVSTATTGARGHEVIVTGSGAWSSVSGGYGAAATVVFFAQSVAGPAASILVDNFVLNDLATKWASSTGTPVISGNQCAISCDTSYDTSLGSTSYYDIRGTYCYAQFLPYTGTDAETGLRLYNDQGNLAVIEYLGGTMTAYLTENGVTTSLGSPVTYSATSHAWWQISESGGTLYFQTAPDGATWTTLWSTAYTLDASSMALSVFAGVYSGSASGTSYVKNFNTAGTTSASGSAALGPMAVSGTVLVTTSGNVASTGSVALAPMVVVATGSNVHGTSCAGSVKLAPLAVTATGAVVLPTTLFPLQILDILVELFVNGTWTDITEYVYQRDPVTITRGRPDEASTISPSTMSVTLNNRDGRFSPRNPSGPYYGTLTRNTQIRLSAPVDVLQEDPLAYRFWGEVPAWPPQWDPTGTDVYAQIQAAGIMRRLTQSGQTALGSALSLYYQNLTGSSAPAAYWPLEDGSGSTSFASFTNGVNPMTFTGSPQLSSDTSFGGSLGLPVLAGAVLTGVLGAAAPQAKLSTQQWKTPGTYTWVAPAGTFEVTGFLTGGGGGGQGGGEFSGRPGGGGGETATDAVGVTPTVHYTLVVGAGGSPGAQGSGNAGNGAATTFTGDSRSITAHGGHGGNSDTQGAGGTGSTAARHYNGGAGGLPSNNIEGSGGGSSAGSNQAGNAGSEANGQRQTPGGAAVTGGGAGGLGGRGGTGNNNTGVGGSAPGGGGGGGGAPLVTGMNNSGGAGAPGQATLSWTSTAVSSVSANILRFLLDVPAAGEAADAAMIQMFTSGSVSEVQVNYGTGGQLRIVGYSTTGATPVTLFDSGYVSFGVNGSPCLVTAELNQSGTNVTWALGTIPPGESQTELFYTGTITAATVASVTSVIVNPSGVMTDSAIGHITVQYVQTPTYEAAWAAAGYAGEDAATRFQRLCGMYNIASEITGSNADCVLMGVQASESLVTLLQECEDADRGQIYEPRSFFGLGYRTRTDMSGQVPVCQLDYAQGQLAQPLQPTDDDQLIANDVVVTRSGGSSFEAIDTTGTMSVNPPPDGIGDYQKSYTINLYADAQLGSEAGWLLALGTVDQQRFPQVSMDLSRTEAAAVFGTVAAVDIGDLITIANPPSWMPPELIQQLAVGWTEVLNAYTWTIGWNCVPALPYFTGIVDDPLFARADTDGSELYASVTSVATTMQVAPASQGYPLWTTTTSDFPFDVMMDGERVTVTSITGTTSPQAFTVVRSVNDVVKSHAAGEDIRLFYPTIVSLT